MSQKITLVAALCGSLLCADSALALKTSQSYSVRFEGQRVGTWRLRNRVVDTGAACLYTVQWSSMRGGAALGRTSLCRLEERKASDEFDCERSRSRFFDTLVQRHLCAPCSGFDDFGQQTTITDFIAGENSDGLLVGIVSTVSVGDVQSFEVM